MKFFVIIGNNALYTYERDGQQFKPQYIEGSDSYAISSVNIGEDVNSYMEILANEKNLGTIAKLEFEMLEGTDQNVNMAIINAFGDHIDKVYKLDDSLKVIFKKLQRDKKLMVETFGINYEGYSYIFKDNDVCRGNYDLLAYTIHCDDVIGLMDL